MMILSKIKKRFLPFSGNAVRRAGRSSVINSKKIIAVLAILFLVTILHPANSAPGGNIFIFNPEGNMQQARTAKIALEKHLEENGISATVYIFASQKDFDEAVDRIKPDFAIVSSYYFDAMSAQYKWQELLSGYNNGSPGFNKILVTPNTINSPEKLKNQGVATISLGPATIKFVDEKFLVPLGLSVNTVRLVTVSKDIDAIMALGFGQVKGAIVTRESFATLQRINPAVVKSLQKLRELPLILHPKVVSFPWAKDREKIKAAIQRLENKGDTGVLLKFLGITNFN